MPCPKRTGSAPVLGAHITVNTFSQTLPLTSHHVLSVLHLNLPSSHHVSTVHLFYCLVVPAAFRILLTWPPIPHWPLSMKYRRSPSHFPTRCTVLLACIRIITFLTGSWHICDCLIPTAISQNLFYLPLHLRWVPPIPHQFRPFRCHLSPSLPPPTFPPTSHLPTSQLSHSHPISVTSSFNFSLIPSTSFHNLTLPSHLRGFLFPPKTSTPFIPSLLFPLSPTSALWDRWQLTVGTCLVWTSENGPACLPACLPAYQTVSSEPGPLKSQAAPSPNRRPGSRLSEFEGTSRSTLLRLPTPRPRPRSGAIAPSPPSGECHRGSPRCPDVHPVVFPN